MIEPTGNNIHSLQGGMPMNTQETQRLEQALHAACPSLELRRDEPMRQHTSFRIGGPAALMALPRTIQEAKAAFQTAAVFGVKPFFLGNGSNLLVADAGYDGFLIKLAGDFAQTGEVNHHLCAGSAVPLGKLACSALDRGLTGLEFASGIPGSLGGAVVMNAGAYGGEMAQVVYSVTCLQSSGNVRTLSAECCDFSYRHSVFTQQTDLCILWVELALTPGSQEDIRAKMVELAERRRARQPLDVPSAGSTFKRPAGHFAAALVEQCGCKGLTIGGAQVSPKHAGFLVNAGGATCADVLALVETVQRRVFDQTGVTLELEIRTLGV